MVHGLRVQPVLVKAWRQEYEEAEKDKCWSCQSFLLSHLFWKHPHKHTQRHNPGNIESGELRAETNYHTGLHLLAKAISCLISLLHIKYMPGLNKVSIYYSKILP